MIKLGSEARAEALMPVCLLKAHVLVSFLTLLQVQGTDNTEKVFLCLIILEASVQSKGPFYVCRVEKETLPQIPFKGMSQ